MGTSIYDHIHVDNGTKSHCKVHYINTCICNDYVYVYTLPYGSSIICVSRLYIYISVCVSMCV